jgi:hypothetical protein
MSNHHGGRHPTLPFKLPEGWVVVKQHRGITTIRKGVPGAVCDHIRLCNLFKEGDEEAKLRRYAVGKCNK